MCAQAAEDREQQARGQWESFDYDAFISYAHHDRPVAAGIQKGLHHIGRRMGHLRALRVFRDSTDLTASPDLWGKVAEAMDHARYLIVVLSPHAVASGWVNKEVSHWLERRGPDQLMFVVAGGRLRWDESTGRFDPDRSDIALPVLTRPGVLTTEPFYVDVSEDAPWDPRAPMFREKVTDLAAPIHGKPKYELASDDLRELHRFRRLRRAAVAGLVLLTVLAVAAAALAFVQRNEAVRQRNEAIARRLVSEAQSMLADSRAGDDVRTLQQLLAASALASITDEGALLDAVIRRRDTLKIIETTDLVESVIFSPDGQRIASGGGVTSGGGDNTVHLWDATTGEPVGEPLTGHLDLVTSVAFSPDGQRIASSSEDKTVRVWDATTGEPVGQPLTGHQNPVTDVAFSPDGQRIASGSSDKTVRVWDATTGEPVGQPLTGHLDSVWGVAFSPDGRRIASGSEDKTVHLWDATTGEPVGEPLTGHSATVSDVAF
ncbi:toll/interleukin-1 receptor domain-containing protein, partial [Rhodococcus sp. IEGM 27]